MYRFLLILWLSPLFIFNSAAAQQRYLQSGPMVGYADFREVLLWAQTKQSAKVYFEYWDVAQPNNKKRTETVVTEKASGFTAKCTAELLEPGRVYGYALYINRKKVNLPYPTQFKTQALWQWRVDPPAFSVAAGSCNYVNEPEYDRPGVPYGSEHGIFTKIYEQHPDLMIWLGDNAYYREVDWSTRSGMLHRFTHSRSLPEIQPLLASTSHYAIWDDHDYGPNDSDGTWAHKEMAWDVFKSFWGNPTYGIDGQKGCTSWFQYNDIDFFMLDNRYFRTPNYCESCPDRTLLGKKQLEWLKAALAQSRAPFKIVAIGNQVITTDKNSETYANFFAAERDSILAHIEREDIRGVVFLDGDRHCTELSAMQNARGNWVYDLTTSSLTAGSFTDAEKVIKNSLRVEGTLVTKHNFAMLRFSGPRTDRQLEMSIYGSDGAQIWTKTIKAREMSRARQ